MSASIHTNVSVYRRGRLQQGYALESDRTKIVLRSRGFSIVVEMQDNTDEDRPQATIKVCGHPIFDTEEHGLKAPDIYPEPMTRFAVLKEARASVALDGQTQHAQEE